MTNQTLNVANVELIHCLVNAIFADGYSWNES